jgi:membrane-bound lytic murein transglycosylase D
MWQFMPYGDYGLARNAYVDERFDPEKSTRAYARYMKFIYNQLGDWYLSMAAYDWGAGNIQRAVQKTGYADFWELYRRNELPTETRNYVPEILAAIIIANHPTQYGFDDITLDPPILTDTVTINYSIDLRLVSDLVGAPVDEVEALNPSLLRMVTPPDGPFDLHLPAGTATLFEQRAALIPEARRNSWRYHPVVAGDTLASVAREYRVTPDELASANQLAPDASISGVDALLVPLPLAAEPSARTRLYVARRGDTLVTIADRFGVSLTQLRRWNSIPSGIRVDAGSRLRVAEPAPVALQSSTSHHRKTSAADGGHGTTASAKSSTASHHTSSSSKSGGSASGRGTSSSKSAGAGSSHSTHRHSKTTSHAKTSAAN